MPKDRLKTLRGSLGLTQKDFAKRLNLSFYQYKDLESGRVSISPALAKLIFYETGFETEWLLHGTGKENRELTDRSSRLLERVVRKTGRVCDDTEKEFFLGLINHLFSGEEKRVEDKFTEIFKVMRK